MFARTCAATPEVVHVVAAAFAAAHRDRFRIPRAERGAKVADRAFARRSAYVSPVNLNFDTSDSNSRPLPKITEPEMLAAARQSDGVHRQDHAA